MYSLRYYTQDGGLIETVLFHAPYGICVWKKNILKETSHTSGVFKISRL